MKKWTKIILITAGILLLLIIVGKKQGWIGKGDNIEVTVEATGIRTIIETVAANGKVQPEIEVKISPDVSGEIIELPVKEGQEVKKGDLLIRINPDIYLSAVDRMNAALNSSRANLANAKARLSQVKAQFISAEASFNRNKSLFDQQAISPAEFESATANYEVAKAEIEASLQTVEGAEYNIRSAEAGLKEASDNLLRTTIYAPVSGTISKLSVEKGERVVGTSQMAGTELMRIADLNEMEITVDVNENDIVRLSLNDTAKIEVDAYHGRKFSGVVTEIANSANTMGLSADQVTNFVVKIRILKDSYKDLQNKIQQNLSPFRPGMSATVDIQTQTEQNVLSVPVQAVTTREDSVETTDKTKENKDFISNKKEKEKASSVNEIVFIYKDGRAYIQKVKTGIQDDAYIQILDGLKTGEEIISGPYRAVSRSLKDSMLVEKVNKKDLFKNDTPEGE